MALAEVHNRNMNPTDHQHLIDELDTLLARIATLLQGFESTGCNLSMKADYIALGACAEAAAGACARDG